MPRPARTGDYVLADVRATVHDQEIPEATRVGFFTEVGSEELVPELDKEVEGKRTGEIVKFNAALPGRSSAIEPGPRSPSSRWSRT